MTRATEHERLKLADAHIAGADRKIARQQALFDELKRGGHDTKTAGALLTLMQKIRDEMQAHRELILAKLDTHQDGPQKNRRTLH